MKKNLNLACLNLNGFVVLILLAFPIFFMSVRHAVHVPLFLLALLAFYKIFTRKSHGAYFQGGQELLVFLAFSGIFISVLVSQIFRHALYFPAFDGPIRIMIAGVVFIFLRTLNIPYIKILGIGIPLGLLSTFISFELYPQASQTYWGGRYATYFVDPNTLGSQSFILCLLCLLMIPPLRMHSFYTFILKLLGFGVGLYLSVGSGSRGGWLTAPFILLLFFIFRMGDISRASEADKAKMQLQTLIIFIGTLSLVALSIYFSDKLSSRIISAYFEVRNWFTGLDLEGSAGVRLSIWKFSLEFAKQSFLFGYGEEKNMIQVLQGSSLNISENMTAINAMALTGPHSDILSKLLSAGIIGLVAYFSVLLIPFSIFWQHRYTLNADIKMASRIGLYYICGVFIAGLSNEQLSLKYLCTFYGLMVATLLAQVLYKPLAIESTRQSSVV